MPPTWQQSLRKLRIAMVMIWASFNLVLWAGYLLTDGMPLFVPLAFLILSTVTIGTMLWITFD